MTLLERKSPELKALAEKLGLRIHRRAGAYWAEDIQLTYKVYKGRVLDLEQKIPYAIDILKNISEARDNKRSIKERLIDLIDNFKGVEYFPNNVFTEMKTQELDELTVLNWRGELTAWLAIIGEPKMELKDHATKDSLLVSLMAIQDSYTKGI